MAGTVVAAGAWELVRESTLVPAEPRIDAAGASVAVFTDIRQGDRGLRCRAREAGEGAEAIPVAAARLDLQVVRDGTTWYLIGFLPEGRDELRVRCAPRDEAADNATYALAAVEGWQSRANLGNGISVLATGAGAVLAVWTWVARRRQRKETARAPA